MRPPRSPVSFEDRTTEPQSYENGHIHLFPFGGVCVDDPMEPFQDATKARGFFPENAPTQKSLQIISGG